MKNIAIKTEDGYYGNGLFNSDEELIVGDKIQISTWDENDTEGLIRAYDYLVKEGYDPKFVKLTLSHEEVEFNFKEKVKKHAKNKLGETEKEVLGIN